MGRWGVNKAMSYIVEVSDHNFQKEVVDASRSKLVVVDFWADWCQPCKTLTPILEKIAHEYAGSFILAKVDMEKCPQLSMIFQIQSIPDVRFIQQGRMVGGFRGAISEADVRRHLKPFLPELPAKEEEPAWKTALESGKWDLASKILERETGREDKAELWHALALAQIGAGHWEKAAGSLNRISSSDPVYARSQFLEALLELCKSQARDDSKLEAFLQQAADQARNRQWRASLDALLELLFRDRAYRDEMPRKAAVGMLDLLVDAAERKSYRRQVSMAVHA